MSTAPVCWSIADVQYATQVDVGGLEVGDPTGDAVFLAVHQSVPIRRLRKAGDESTAQRRTENDVLADFTQELAAPEPHLLFITGQAGTGKSHLVRWLRSRIGDRPNWHVIYVEKRNTSLRRIIEKILVGIDTPRARELLAALAKASSELRTVDEATHALLQRLEHLVRFDSLTTVGAVSGADLVDLRDKAGRLLGDYTVKERLSRKNGPIERITKLAMPRFDNSVDEGDVEEKDLHISSEDLLLEPADFVDAGAQLERLVRSVVTNHALRQDLATLMDHYLARAKADVFTGRSADLLDVFEEVRREVAARGQELCLFIEDLVLLHGIDTELAQALTISATSELCRIRAVIAVTAGYLRAVTTFEDRGIHYTMDVERSAFERKDLRSFVARYLNAGRVGRLRLREEHEADGAVPNACAPCSFRSGCHKAFGATSSGVGYYPFNESALDFLIERASPGTFDPRTILREVVRHPLETADSEIHEAGRFPSKDFVAVLDPQRSRIAVEQQAALQRDSANGEQELSLRGLYAKRPPFDDAGLQAVADWFGISLTQLEGGGEEADGGDEPSGNGDRGDKEQGDKKAVRSSLDRWVLEGVRLPAAEANRIRGWLLETIAARLQGGAHGVLVRKVKQGEWAVGSLPLRLADFDIENSGGSGAVSGAHVLKFKPTATDATLLKGIQAVAGGGSLAGPDRGRWYFDLCARMSVFEESLVGAALRDRTLPDARAALTLLSISQLFDDQRAEGSGQLVRSMLRTPNTAGLHPAIVTFFNNSRDLRRSATRYLRDNYTEKKGTGACTIFDAGPLLRLLRELESVREVPTSTDCSEEMRKALDALRDRHERAAREVWDGLRPITTQLKEVLDPGEDLVETIGAMDRLIDEAHAHGLLPGVDVRNQYQDVKAQLSTDVMGKYRYVVENIDASIEASTLWELTNRVDESLGKLLLYSKLCQHVLTTIEARVEAVDPAGKGTDRSELDQAMRDLAAALDQLDKDQ